MVEVFISSQKTGKANVRKSTQNVRKNLQIFRPESKRNLILTQINLLQFSVFSSIGYMCGSYLNAVMNESFDYEQLGMLSISLRSIVLYSVLGSISIAVYKKHKKELVGSNVQIFVLSLISAMFFILIGISPMGNLWNTIPVFIETLIFIIGTLLFFPAMLSLLFLPIGYIRFLKVLHNESS